jgi:hypothetical protein
MMNKKVLPKDIQQKIELSALIAYEEEKARTQANLEVLNKDRLKKQEVTKLKRCMFIADLFVLPYDKEDVLKRCK